jgi:o-succinylbenzoate synthase
VTSSLPVDASLVATSVTADAARVRIPVRRPFATAAGTWHEREAWIVRLRDAEGRIGVGEACLDPAAMSDAVDALAQRVRAVIPELAAPGALASWLADDPGDGAPELAVRAAIAGAALDLGLVSLGDAEGRSVRVNATIATEDAEATIAAARDAIEAGFDCLKIKGGSERSTRDLVDRLAAVRALVGPSVELRLDVNGAWDVPTAHDRLVAFAGLDLAYVEQPIPVGDIGALADLRRSSPVRIAADESVAARSAARALIDAAAVDVLVVKPARVGGPIEALAIARDAETAGLEVTVSTLLETGVGITAALRVAAALAGDGAHGLATADVLADDLLATPLAVAAGRMPVRATRGGGGIGLDAAAMDRWTIERVGAAS